MSGTSSVDTLTGDDLLRAVAEIEAKRPPVDRVIVTRLCPVDRCLEVKTRRWMLVAPGDMDASRDAAADWLEIPGAELPAGARLFGLPIEHAEPGGPLEREVLLEITKILAQPSTEDHDE